MTNEQINTFRQKQQTQNGVATMRVMVKDLKPGDYVIPAKATVLEVDSFICVTIIDFTDKTSTAPIYCTSMVDIERKQ